MRELFSRIICLLLTPAVAGPVLGQIAVPFVSENVEVSEGYPLAGSHLLTAQAEQARQYVAQHPDWETQMRLQKTVAWNFNVGDQHSWVAYNFVTGQHYPVSSTCRAVGTHCYIFVEDAAWQRRVNQAAVDSVRVGFDLRTPANRSKGIYQMNVEAFGEPPNVDNDNRIIILILDIQDGWSGSGGFIAGYFSPLNQTTLPNSNRAEIYYVDANPVNLAQPSGLEIGLKTTAHEFQHMIHYRYDTDELVFINETASMTAEVHVGYAIEPQTGYVTETNFHLLSWRGTSNPNSYRDYARAARFGVYLRDQFGIAVFKPLVQNPLNGLDGLNAAFQAIGTPLRFDDVFKNWLLANILDDRAVNPVWGYFYPNLPKAVGRLHANPNVPLTGDLVQHLGAVYLAFKDGLDLRIRFIVENPLVLIKAVEIGTAAKRVLDITPGTEFYEPEYGTTYQEIHFVIINTGQAFPYNFSYQASGVAKPVELKWDETEPVGYQSFFVASDTICVTFDAVPGGRLDSIRVALRRKGSMTGGIWRSTGNIRPTPLGKALAVPITAVSDTTPPVINPQGPYPYPIPYPGWRKVDLRSFNISTDQPFAVAFVVAGDPLDPRNNIILGTLHPGSDPYHNFVYLNRPLGGGQRNWYFLADTQANLLWLHLIRAYVSFETSTGVRETVELTPASFSLAQNYPNPFNPSTTIAFTLPRPSHATLKIFNTLGEEIALLIDKKLEAGQHKVEWSAEGLPSGVYFYRLQSEGFVETRRLVLLR
ncbi:MAG: T9SS type A sorting domain-containing protein [candidate division KSB1 bacterium]|nr:T9SS type A sorting domain-containing protein [candidate division KSB1 bacterium]